MSIVLTQNAIKRHAKRLQAQMQSFNQELSLGQSQTLLSKILGFNDWNHLLTVYKNETTTLVSPINNAPTINDITVDTNNDFYQFVINSDDIEQEKKDLFVSSYEYFCNYKEEINVGKQIYKNTQDFSKEKTNNNDIIVKYIIDCITKDNVQDFIDKTGKINIYYPLDYLLPQLLNFKAFKIAQYVIDKDNYETIDNNTVHSMLFIASVNGHMDKVKFLVNNFYISYDYLRTIPQAANVEILSYLIEDYKIKNPNITDFTPLINNLISCEAYITNINIFKYLTSLSSTIFNDVHYTEKFINNLIYSNTDTRYGKKMTYHKYNKLQRLATLSHLIHTLKIKKTKNIVTLLNNAPYYKKVLNKI